MNENQISDTIVGAAGYKKDATISDEEIRAKLRLSLERRCSAYAGQKGCQKQRRFLHWFPLDRLFSWLGFPPSSR